MLHCKYHVGVALVALTEHTPTFVTTGNDTEVERKDRRRIILHCPVPKCPVVAIQHDPDKIDPFVCRICKKATVVGTSLCIECGREYRKTLLDYKRKRQGASTADPRRPRLQVGP
jgi:hypothetical protein